MENQFKVSIEKCAVCGCFKRNIYSFDEPKVRIEPEVEKMMSFLDGLSECKQCKYVNTRISKKPPKGVDEQWLRSEAYISCEGLELGSEYMRKYRYYMIQMMTEDPYEQVEALLDLRRAFAGSGTSVMERIMEMTGAKLVELYREILASNPEDYKSLYGYCEELKEQERYAELIDLTEKMSFPDTEKGRAAKAIAVSECASLGDYYRITVSLREAFRFLENHPVFNGYFQDCLDISLICLDYDSGKKGIKLQCGPYKDGYFVIDRMLDVKEETFEKAIKKLAGRVLKKYGGEQGDYLGKERMITNL